MPFMFVICLYLFHLLCVIMIVLYNVLYMYIS